MEKSHELIFFKSNWDISDNTVAKFIDSFSASDQTTACFRDGLMAEDFAQK